MTIYNILNQMGIDIPCTEYIFEYLLNNKRQNCFYIDILPLAVSRENGNKFDQVSFYYQEIVHNKKLKKEYIKYENRYKEFITKLWLYNTLYIECEPINLKESKKYIDIDYKIIKNSFISKNKKELVLIDNKNNLDTALEIGCRNIAFPMFYFADFQLILTNSWSCMVAYINDISQYKIINEIATSCQLFLRKPLQ